MKRIVIVSAIVLILMFASIFNSHVFNHLPWDTSISFKHNITPYFVVLIVIFACYTSINTIFLSLGVENKSKHKHRTIGTILNIEYSGIRVGNAPRFKVTVEYEGISKSFDALDEAVQFNLNIGDDAVIYYEKGNLTNSHIDLEETIRLQSENGLVELDINAKFKLLEINPTNENSIYALVGEVIIDNQPVRKAQIEHRIDDGNIMKFVPGMIIPCRIDGEGDDLEISMSIP